MCQMKEKRWLIIILAHAHSISSDFLPKSQNQVSKNYDTRVLVALFAVHTLMISVLYHFVLKITPKQVNFVLIFSSLTPNLPLCSADRTGLLHFPESHGRLERIWVFPVHASEHVVSGGTWGSAAAPGTDQSGSGWSWGGAVEGCGAIRGPPYPPQQARVGGEMGWWAVGE